MISKPQTVSSRDTIGSIFCKFKVRRTAATLMNVRDRGEAINNCHQVSEMAGGQKSQRGCKRPAARLGKRAPGFFNVSKTLCTNQKYKK